MNKIQTLAEYQQLASRTCPDLGIELNIMHMKLGIITEIGETLDIFKKNLAYNKPIDMVNLGEELADILWYVVNEAAFNKLSITILNEPLYGYVEKHTEQERIYDTCIYLMTYLSHREQYNSQKLINILQQICAIWEIDFFQILTNNIAKLQVRYPDKFTNEAALNRDLDAERKKLEQTGEEVTEKSNVE